MAKINTLKNYFKDIDSKLIEPLTILDREHYQAISSRMNVLVEKIIQNDNTWLESNMTNLGNLEDKGMPGDFAINEFSKELYEILDDVLPKFRDNMIKVKHEEMI